MKKFFFPFAMLVSIAANAQVGITNMATIYATKQISFTVTWTAQPYNNQIWVITDYIKVNDATTVGAWSRALVTAVTKTTGTGSVATVSDNRGFWINTSGATGSADVTATLSLAPGVDKFNWCAFALNYPPKAVIKAGGGYDLKGTPPFKINGNITEITTVFAPGTCITSITDATDNPAGIVPANPSISLSAGSSGQAATMNITLPTLQYTTANASGATCTAGSFPTGVSGTWNNNIYTISGTPTATGTFTYTVTTTNSNGCTNASRSGTMTVNSAITYQGCNTTNIALGTVGFTASTTYSANGLTLSSPVTVTYCNNRSYSSFNGGSSGAYKADCAKNYYNTASGNWFSWCMVKQYAHTLCPSPWRVPTQEDFCKIVNGNESSCGKKSGTYNGYIGFAFNGLTENSTCYYGGDHGYWWTTTDYSTDKGIYMAIDVTDTYPSGTMFSKLYGFALRCVR
jgi:uncharacterized protein (TIGR02145 family)